MKTEFQAGKKPHILVVDDEPKIISLVREIFKFKEGYRMTGITDSKKAHQLFRKQPENFDLVLTDLVMPRLNGLELAGKLLTINPEVPIILISGSLDMATKQTAERLGICETIHKPFELLHFMKKIDNVLNGRAR